MLPIVAVSLGTGTIALVTENRTQSVDQRIADQLGVAVRQVRAAIELLDGGATVPFIARYRKEATGTLDDAQLRTLEERLHYLRELDERREAILVQIAAQGQLTGELEAQIRAADSKARLEDLYLPTSPSGAPRLRSPVRRAWSRWPTCCSTTRPGTRRPKRKASSTPGAASTTRPPRWRGPAPSWSNGSPRTPT